MRRRASIRALRVLQEELRACRACPRMVGPVVVGRPVPSRLFLVGQAPGPREGALGRPFAWTAGRTLFAWFARLGVDEENFRARVHVAAVCRCFPGKTAAGGDRVPDRAEVLRCGAWMAREVALQRPDLVIPVGRLAIEQVLGTRDAHLATPAEAPCGRAMQHAHLEDVVGRIVRGTLHGMEVDVAGLPHPSGLSSWWKVEPGRTLVDRALRAIGRHPAFRLTFPQALSGSTAREARGK